MNNKFILVGLGDENSKYVAGVINNKTCKKILDFLAENKEANEKELSEKLNIKINTIEYNLQKLVKSGLVEKSKNFFWSTKGKKIIMYKLSNKQILISPKKFIKGIIPAFIGVAFLSFLIKVFSENLSKTNPNIRLDSAKTYAVKPIESSSNIVSNTPEIWPWFLLGGLIALSIVLLWNIFIKMKGGSNE